MGTTPSCRQAIHCTMQSLLALLFLQMEICFRNFSNEIIHIDTGYLLSSNLCVGNVEISEYRYADLLICLVT